MDPKHLDLGYKVLTYELLELVLIKDICPSTARCLGSVQRRSGGARVLGQCQGKVTIHQWGGEGVIKDGTIF